jgi:CRP/FNR family transcriptional regulator, polysaccharide utilization system transcription regulator
MKGNCCVGQCTSLEGSVLSELTEKERCVIRNYSLTVNFKKGQNIFEQGKGAEGLFCIQQGKIKVALESNDGQRVTVNLYADQGTIGHQSLFSSTNIYTATCLTDSTVCFLPKNVLRSYLPLHPSMASRVNEIISKEFIQLNELVLSMRTKSVVQRLAEGLIKLQNIFGKDKHDNIDIELTKEEIAFLVGSSTESIFRTLSDFKKKRFIEIRERRIKILNETKLRSMGKIFT